MKLVSALLCGLFSIQSWARLETQPTPYTEGVSRVFPAVGDSTFVEDFAKTNNLTICGINLVCAPVQGPSALPTF